MDKLQRHTSSKENLIEPMTCYNHPIPSIRLTYSSERTNRPKINLSQPEHLATQLIHDPTFLIGASCSVLIAELFKNLLAHPRHKLQFSNRAVYNPVKILFLRVRSALQNEDSYGEEILLLFFLLISVKIAQS